MASSVEKERWSRRSGTGGAPEPHEIWTHGEKRLEVDENYPAVLGMASSGSPPAPTGVGQGTWFFRNNGAGKSQFCVRFPSGAVQVIATEP